MNFDINPEISVILCTYNREQYLKNCINSVVNQSFQNWELIIVDDGSQDQSFKVVNEYLQNFRNIRYIKHQNRKQGYAKNVGIQASFGQYITFIDSDDTYKSNHLESRIKYMRSHPEIDLIQGGFALKEEFLLVDYFNSSMTISVRNCVLGPTFFGKRFVFFELKGFDNMPYGEDTDFWCRAEKVFKTKSITAPETYIYTRAETSITKTVFQNILN